MRTIKKVIPSESGKVIVQSNDGKLYSLQSENGGFWWDELPPLPQGWVGCQLSTHDNSGFVQRDQLVGFHDHV